MAEKHNMFIQALGRYVSGDTIKKREKDNRGVAIAPEKQRIEFGVAIPKTDPDLTRVFGEISTYWNTNYANSQPHLQAYQNWYNGGLVGLSMKISDGDKPNKKGQLNENTKGCYVFWFSSGYSPKACNSATQEIDLATIKRGDYVHMSMSIQVNDLPLGDGCGIYLNPAIMMLVYEGVAITGGVDAETAFAGMQVSAQMPAGASPLGSAMGAPGGVAGGMPGQAPAAQGQGMPQQAAHDPNVPVQGQPQTAHATMPTATGLPGGAGQPTASVTSGGLPGQAPTGQPQPAVQQQQMPQPHPTILGNPPTGLPG